MHCVNKRFFAIRVQALIDLDDGIYLLLLSIFCPLADMLRITVIATTKEKL